MATDTRQIDINLEELKGLEPVAHRLNAATNKLDDALRTIQDRFNALGLGVEVWLPDPLDRSAWRDVVDPRTEESTGAREYDAWELGYARSGDAWALLVRTRRYLDLDPRDPNTAVEAFEDGCGFIPLVRAPRRLRLAAMNHIPKLIAAIRAEAESSIAAVEQVQKIADALA